MSANAYDLLVSRHPPSAVALVEGDRSVTYGELDELTARIGRLLAERGVSPADRVLTYAPDEILHAAFVLAGLRRGAIVVVGNQLAPASEVAFMRASAGPKLILAGEVTPVGAGDAVISTAELRSQLVGTSPDPHVEAVAPGDPALWQYTQLADGANVPVVHTHRAMEAAANLFPPNHLSLTPEDRCLSVAKLCFGYGFGNSLVFPLAYGATSVLHPGRVDPLTVLDVVTSARPTVFFAVPTFYANLLRVPDVLARHDLSSIRLIVSAGEELSASLANDLMATLRVPLVDGLGSTEMFHIFLGGPVEDGGVLGYPISGNQVRLLDAEGREADEGTLWVQSPYGATEYHGDPERSRRVFVDGWVRVSDRLARRQDGRYAYRGRTDDIIMVSGQKVVLGEVRRTLCEHPSVREARLEIQRTDAGLTRVCARIVLRDVNSKGMALALRRHARSRLLPHKCPAEFVFVEAECSAG